MPPKMKQPAAAVSVKDAKKAAKKPASKKAAPKKADDDEESKGDHEMTRTEVEDASQEIEMINTKSKGRVPAT